MVQRLCEPGRAAHLFEGWQETMIWSCLQGVMGEIYGMDQESPQSAMAVLGDFCFLAGRPEEALLRDAPVFGEKDFWILVPQNPEWSTLIEDCFLERVRKGERYAFQKEMEVFGSEPHRERLQRIVDALPPEYTLQMMDEETFFRCREQAWCRDWTAQYPDYTAYQKYGLGAVIRKAGELVSGASSYSGYRGGIEIEIDTREDCRRQGLARVCGAKLILECLERGLYPSWDAQNPGSAVLAEELGYEPEGAYPIYELWG